jgi:hypothetical protein
MGARKARRANPVGGSSSLTFSGMCFSPDLPNN